MSEAFLDRMAEGSARRLEAARSLVPEREIAARAAALPPPPPLVLHADGFDIIAELKLRSPSAGTLSDDASGIEERVRTYARAGAAAVSVLTEPERFGGELGHLERAAAALAPLRVPAMRKDFLLDPYQVSEARLAGAGGVLAIARMLDDGALRALIDSALGLGMFVLLEAFDVAEIERCADLISTYPEQRRNLPLGLNCRDLQTLQIDPARLDAAAGAFPRDTVAVAESGLFNPADARRLAGHGYQMALIGTALMQTDDAAALLCDLLEAGRAARDGAI
jgi:indole-3-glycerol phosphate synthase